MSYLNAWWKKALKIVCAHLENVLWLTSILSGSIPPMQYSSVLLGRKRETTVDGILLLCLYTTNHLISVMSEVFPEQKFSQQLLNLQNILKPKRWNEWTRWVQNFLIKLKIKYFLDDPAVLHPSGNFYGLKLFFPSLSRSQKKLIQYCSHEYSAWVD